MTVVLLVLSLALSLSSAMPMQAEPPDIVAQGADTAVLTGPGVEVSAAPRQESSVGLPPRATPPRTMERQWPAFAAFALTWIGIIGYMLATGRRVGRLAAGLRDVEKGR